ncbi:hypothetical protein N656DRAFT_708738 [Canariomyces notabilis]|uniref:BZIP domain-containing protein n=1 Tax=Canariomyces notabilis TaxID=2074819 RepID=A0AAN6YSB0_9PEZI|nr:hypothetical protein N656DRAFT_708738 [Canariomyces arenarius]
MADAARTSRLTENKRRYRARRKEYVADLERRLEEMRVQGINATAQVQLAARKVVAENGRLRELLQLAGFTAEDIDLWAKSEHADYKGLAMQRENAASPQKDEGKRRIKTAGTLPGCTGTSSNAMEPVVTPKSHQSPHSMAETATCPSPCKLLSLLAENPSADITQVTAHPRSIDPPAATTQDEGGDVECGKAYEMLMQYATSEKKMDYIARALEAGCTPTKPGACAVKKKVIWEALDNMCG